MYSDKYTVAAKSERKFTVPASKFNIIYSNYLVITSFVKCTDYINPDNFSLVYTEWTEGKGIDIYFKNKTNVEMDFALSISVFFRLK